MVEVVIKLSVWIKFKLVHSSVPGKSWTFWKHMSCIMSQEGIIAVCASALTIIWALKGAEDKGKRSSSRESQSVSGLKNGAASLAQIAIVKMYIRSGGTQILKCIEGFCECIQKNSITCSGPSHPT